MDIAMPGLMETRPINPPQNSNAQNKSVSNQQSSFAENLENAQRDLTENPNNLSERPYKNEQDLQTLKRFKNGSLLKEDVGDKTRKDSEAEELDKMLLSQNQILTLITLLEQFILSSQSIEEDHLDLNSPIKLQEINSLGAELSFQNLLALQDVETVQGVESRFTIDSSSIDSYKEILAYFEQVTQIEDLDLKKLLLELGKISKDFDPLDFSQIDKLDDLLTTKLQEQVQMILNSMDVGSYSDEIIDLPKEVDKSGNLLEMRSSIETLDQSYNKVVNLDEDQLEALSPHDYKLELLQSKSLINQKIIGFENGSKTHQIPFNELGSNLIMLRNKDATQTYSVYNRLRTLPENDSLTDLNKVEAEQVDLSEGDLSHITIDETRYRESQEVLESYNENRSSPVVSKLSQSPNTDVSLISREQIEPLIAESEDNSMNDKIVFQLNSLNSKSISSLDSTNGPKPATDLIPAKSITPEDIPILLSNRLNDNLLSEESMRIRLYPKELGEVRIALSVKGEVVNMKLEFENPLSQKMVEDQMPVLKKALESQGLELGEFSLGTGSFNQQGSFYNKLEVAEEFSYLLGTSRDVAQINNEKTAGPINKNRDLRRNSEGVIDYWV